MFLNSILNGATLYVIAEIITMMIGVFQVATHNANPWLVTIICAICFICLHKLSEVEIILPIEKQFNENAPELKKIIFNYTKSKDKTNKYYAYVKRVSDESKAKWCDAITDPKHVEEGSYLTFGVQKGFACVIRAVFRNNQWQILENPFGNYAKDLTIIAYDKHSFVTLDEALSQIDKKGI